MIDALKDIVQIFEKLPQYTIWVLLGVLFYKVIIIGSWFSIIRLLINKAYSYSTLPTQELPIQKVLINEKFVSTDMSYKELLWVLDLILAKRNYLRKPVAGTPERFVQDNHVFLNMEDVAWFRRAVYECAEKEELAIKLAIEKEPITKFGS